MDALLSLLDLLPESFNSSNSIVRTLLIVFSAVIVVAAFMKSSSFIINSIKDTYYRFIKFIKNKKSTPENPPSFLNLSDEEFNCFKKVEKIERGYTLKVDDDKNIYEGLVSKGVFLKKMNRSYKITKPWKKRRKEEVNFLNNL